MVILIAAISALVSFFKFFAASFSGGYGSYSWYKEVRRRHESIYGYRKIHCEAYTIIDAIADCKFLSHAALRYFKLYRFILLLLGLFLLPPICSFVAIWRTLDLFILAAGVAKCVARKRTSEFAVRKVRLERTVASFFTIAKLNIRVSNFARVRMLMRAAQGAHQKFSLRLFIKVI